MGCLRALLWDGWLTSKVGPRPRFLEQQKGDRFRGPCKPCGPQPLYGPLSRQCCPRAQPLGGSCHGYWEEEAICVEMKVSMTPWLEGSRWLWPLVESEL